MRAARGALRCAGGPSCGPAAGARDRAQLLRARRRWRDARGRKRLEPRGELICGDRAAQVVALREVAAERLQPAHDLLVLDALRYDLEAEVAAEIDRGADDRVVVLVFDHVHD